MIDSHCHLDHEPLFSNLDNVIERSKKNGLKKILTICTTIKSFTKIKEIVKKDKIIFGTFGIHPHEVKNDKVSSSLIIKEIKNNKKIIGIGETGLDYFHVKKDDADWQRERFRRHISASNESGKPMIVHMRDSKNDTIRILSEEKAEAGVMHCFTGDWETAKAALDLGMHISFSGILTFNNAKPLREVAKKIPADRLLVETDCPYLIPKDLPTKPKNNRNEPSNLNHIVKEISLLLDLNEDEIRKESFKNTLRFFESQN